MTVRPTYNYFDDEHPDLVLISLKKTVRRWLQDKNCALFYIGQTCNPVKRLWTHQKTMRDANVGLWDAMHVIYGSQSLGFVNRVESELIDLVQNHPKHVKQVWNICKGRYEGQSTFKVYVLVDDQATTMASCVAIEAEAMVNDDRRRSIGNVEADVIACFERAISRKGKRGETAQAFYVGYTDAPDRRFAQHQTDSKFRYKGEHWDDMKVIFETNDLDRALMMETRLIKHARESYGSLACMNENGGRRLDDDGKLPYTYVYFLWEMNNGKYEF